MAVPAFGFTLSPLAPRGTDPGALAPDRAALDVMAPPSRQRLMRTLAALGIVLALWLAWWLYRHVRDAHVMPFARARRTISRLPKAGRAHDAAAWVALHRAFNAVAGRAVGRGSVEQVYRSAPWLQAQADAIASFFSASDQRFFQSPADAGRADIDVETLCEQLYRMEKRHSAGPGG